MATKIKTNDMTVSQQLRLLADKIDKNQMEDLPPFMVCLGGIDIRLMGHYPNRLEAVAWLEIAKQEVIDSLYIVDKYDGEFH